MDTFCLSKDNITLKPLTYNDIDDRIIWNTTITDWKREENPMEDTANAFLFNEEKYRIKKKEEICSGGKRKMDYILRWRYLLKMFMLDSLIVMHIHWSQTSYLELI